MSPPPTAPSNPAPPTLARAVGQFNAGEYFACHETLEELWLAEESDLRYLYQGILQIGVGLFHLRRGNEAGALTLLARGSRLLLPFAPVNCGLDVGALLRAAKRIHNCLLADGCAAAQGLLERDPPQLHRLQAPSPG
jgi:uncharacterized protein